MEGFYVIFNRAEKTIQFAVSKCNVIDRSAVRSYIQGNISLSGNVPYTLYCPLPNDSILPNKSAFKANNSGLRSRDIMALLFVSKS